MYNVIHHSPAHTTHPPTPLTRPLYTTLTRSNLYNSMALPHHINSAQKEGRINLAINSIQKKHFSSQRRAVRIFKAPRTTMRDRIKGVLPKSESGRDRRLLRPTEEEELIKWIRSIEQRGFVIFLIDIRRIAQVLLDRRGSDASQLRKIRKNWLTRWLAKFPAFNACYIRLRDAQRAKNEDLRIIRPWFERFAATLQEYGIVNSDIYNFDKTGFAIGLGSGGSSKAVTSESCGRITVIQPGNRLWTTVIECVNSSGWSIPPFVILEGKIHMQSWYQLGLPPD